MSLARHLSIVGLRLKPSEISHALAARISNSPVSLIFADLQFAKSRRSIESYFQHATYSNASVVYCHCQSRLWSSSSSPTFELSVGQSLNQRRTNQSSDGAYGRQNFAQKWHHHENQEAPFIFSPRRRRRRRRLAASRTSTSTRATGQLSGNISSAPSPKRLSSRAPT